MLSTTWPAACPDRLTGWFAEPSAGSARAAPLLRRIVAATALLLLAVTWRLWTPQTLYPRVPLFAWAGGMPGWMHFVGLAVGVAGLLAALIAPTASRYERWGLFAFSFAVALMVVLDEHRLQPWAWQLGLAALVLAATSARRATALLRMLTVGIYLHSALSKLDRSFLTTNGQELLGGLLESMGLSLRFWSEETRIVAAALLPLGELLIAIGLCIPRTRRPAFFGAVAMHVLLLAALGPWGLGHRPGVLIWNGYFLLQDWLLFGPLPAPLVGEAEANTDALSTGGLSPSRTRTACAAEGLILAAVLLPILEPFGWWDHWPAWAVYASRPERVYVYVHRSAAGRLPETVREHLGPPPALEPWRRLRIDRWSLASLNVPIYPQGRFRLAVAWAVAERCRLDSAIRVVVESPAERLTGGRTRRTLTGIDELSRETERFWLTARGVWPSRESDGSGG